MQRFAANSGSERRTGCSIFQGIVGKEVTQLIVVVLCTVRLGREGPWSKILAYIPEDLQTAGLIASTYDEVSQGAGVCDGQAFASGYSGFSGLPVHVASACDATADTVPSASGTLPPSNCCSAGLQTHSPSRADYESMRLAGQLRTVDVAQTDRTSTKQYAGLPRTEIAGHNSIVVGALEAHAPPQPLRRQHHGQERRAGTCRSGAIPQQGRFAHGRNRKQSTPAAKSPRARTIAKCRRATDQRAGSRVNSACAIHPCRIAQPGRIGGRTGT